MKIKNKNKIKSKSKNNNKHATDINKILYLHTFHGVSIAASKTVRQSEPNLQLAERILLGALDLPLPASLPEWISLDFYVFYKN